MPKQQPPLHILSVEARNFMRLEVATIKPDGSLVVLEGKNGAGKTSILNAMLSALAGKRAVPEEAMKRDATSGSVKVELGPLGGPTVLTARRSFELDGPGELRLTTPDGPVRNGQTILDRIVGKLSFDPELFRSMPRKDRAEYLLSVVGLDFTKLDARRLQLFDKRTEVGRTQRAAAQRALEARPSDSEDAWEIPDEVPTDDFQAAVEQTRDAITAGETLIEKASHATEMRGRIEREFQGVEEQLSGLKAKLETLSVDRAEALGLERTLKSEAESVDGPALVTKHAMAEGALGAAQETNRSRTATASRQERLEELDAISAKENTRYGQLTENIDAIDLEKTDALAGAEFPVEGLTVEKLEKGGTEVRYEGTIFDNVEESVQIRISVAMAMKLNPGLRVAFVRHGSGLDGDQIKLIHELVNAQGGQVWLEMVRTDEGQEGVVQVVNGVAMSEAVEG